MYRLYHLLFVISFKLILILGYIYSFLIGKKKRFHTTKKIAAFPYYPQNYTGGEIRIGNWKIFFEKDGISFDVFWCGNSDELIKSMNEGVGSKLYFFYFKILLKRSVQLIYLKNYDSIWIQRAYIPFYPFKKSYFEKLIKKINPNLIIDFYDADYIATPRLIHEAANFAKKITVVNNYLANHFKKYNSQVEIVRLALKENDYIPKKFTEEKKELIIGWMGSPENSKELIFLENILILLENKFQNIRFKFICRKLTPLKLNKLTIKPWTSGNEYFQDINDFDIGIAPSFNDNEINRGKVSMKTIEMMASGIPIITSKISQSNIIKHNHNALIAHTIEDWHQQFELLINDAGLRQRLGQQARLDFLEFHTYKSQYTLLKDILIK